MSYVQGNNLISVTFLKGCFVNCIGIYMYVLFYFLVPENIDDAILACNILAIVQNGSCPSGEECKYTDGIAKCV